MPRLQVTAAAACAVLLLVVWARHRQRMPYVRQPAAAMAGEPRVMLWAWETPEDLTTLDPASAGVAFLAREVFLTQQVSVRERRQPLRLAPGTWLMADVRMEAHLPAGARLDDSAAGRAAVVRAILPATRLPGVRALQIDFDATATQLESYAHLLRDLRTAMPAGMPLSVTLLPSWCGDGGFAGRLHTGIHTAARPVVDEGVTMEFRLGGPRSGRLEPKSTVGLTQPLCATALGVATDETWPTLDPRQRVYVFRDGPWTTEDLARLRHLGVNALRVH